MYLCMAQEFDFFKLLNEAANASPTLHREGVGSQTQQGEIPLIMSILHNK